MSDSVAWSTGLSNMLDWLTWSTNDVLGVSKTTFAKRIIEWTCEATETQGDIKSIQQYVKKQLNAEMARSEKLERYDKPESSLASPREALRRAKYFSEDYLNKEFDVFMSLASDRYLDAYYHQFTNIKMGGSWAVHGNGPLFVCSVGISEMQMDNLAYNASNKLLVANELKLGGKKNADQILKYGLMFELLKQRGFVDSDSRFLLLFLGDRKGRDDWSNLIDEEIEYCRKTSKSTASLALDSEGAARSAVIASTTWHDLVEFNYSYLSKLDKNEQQVEIKLIEGFNESLLHKAFMAT